MRYLLLIYEQEPTEPPPDDVAAAEYAAYDAFTNEVRDRGIYEAGEALRSTATATTVRVRDGETIALAAKIPAAKRGSIEVRPIWDLEATPGATSGAAEAVG